MEANKTECSVEIRLRATKELQRKLDLIARNTCRDRSKMLRYLIQREYAAQKSEPDVITE